MGNSFGAKKNTEEQESRKAPLLQKSLIDAPPIEPHVDTAEVYPSLVPPPIGSLAPLEVPEDEISIAAPMLTEAISVALPLQSMVPPRLDGPL